MLDETVIGAEFIEDGLKDHESFSSQPYWAKTDSSGINELKLSCKTYQLFLLLGYF